MNPPTRMSNERYTLVVIKSFRVYAPRYSLRYQEGENALRNATPTSASSSTPKRRNPVGRRRSLAQATRFYSNFSPTTREHVSVRAVISFGVIASARRALPSFAKCYPRADIFGRRSPRDNIPPNFYSAHRAAIIRTNPRQRF